MKIQLSIRKRIFSGLLFLGVMLSIAFTAAIRLSADYLENEILQSTYNDEIQSITKQYNKSKTWLPNSSHTKGFLSSSGKVPNEFIRFGVGQHHDIHMHGKSYHLFVTDLGYDTLYLALEIEAIERYENQLNMFLAAIVCSLSLGSLWVSMWFTGWIAQPVTTLSKKIENLTPRDKQLPVSAHDTDLAVIEQSVNKYLTLINEHMISEQLFSGMASHELRTPLTTIRTSLQTLRSHLSPSDEKQIQRADRINRASLEMQYITESLLSIAKYDSKPPLESSPYELTELLMLIAEEHKPLLRSEAVQLISHTKTSAVTTIKPELMKIVVGNLVRNALQNTSEGIVTITSTEHSVSITDSGTGTPSDIINWLNDPITNSQPHTLTGIGLLIVVRLCKQLNINLHVTDGPTGGSEFLLSWGQAAP